MVSNTTDDFPEPETPVKIVICRFGIRSVTSLRLFSRAPRISMNSVNWSPCAVRRSRSIFGHRGAERLSCPLRRERLDLADEVLGVRPDDRPEVIPLLGLIAEIDCPGTLQNGSLLLRQARQDPVGGGVLRSDVAGRDRRPD